MQVERTAHCSDDRRQTVHLSFARPMLFIDVVEITASDRRGESLGHILDPALRERDDLVVVRLALDRTGQQLDGDTPIYGQNIDERFQGQARRGPHTSVIARSIRLLGPGWLEVGAEG